MQEEDISLSKEPQFNHIQIQFLGNFNFQYYFEQKLDFHDKNNKLILYALQVSHHQKKEWYNQRINDCLYSHRVEEQKSSPPHEKLSISKPISPIDFVGLAQFNSNLHPNNLNIGRLGRTKQKIFSKICPEDVMRTIKGYEVLILISSSMNFLDQISDPKQLGRYKNFIGASSKVANYIRALSKNIQKNFIKNEDVSDQQKLQKQQDIQRFQTQIKDTFSLIHDINTQDQIQREDYSPMPKQNKRLYLRTTFTRRATDNQISQNESFSTEIFNCSYDNTKQQFFMDRIHANTKQKHFPGLPIRPKPLIKIRLSQPNSTIERIKPFISPFKF